MRRVVYFEKCSGKIACRQSFRSEFVNEATNNSIKRHYTAVLLCSAGKRIRRVNVIGYISKVSKYLAGLLLAPLTPGITIRRTLYEVREGSMAAIIVRF